MILLHRYTLKAYGKTFLLSLAAFLGIYLLVDFFEKVDKFIEHQADFSLYVLYFANKIPMIIAQVTPLAVLMGVFMTLGGFSRTNELTAMRASGIGLVRISLPLLGMALATVLAVLCVNEYLVPLCVKKSNYILQTEVKGKPSLAVKRDRVWFRDENAIVNVDLAYPEKGLLQGISIFVLNDKFKLVRRTDAAQATFADQRWTFEDLIERSFNTQTRSMSNLQHFKSKPLDFGKTPEDFRTTSDKNEELDYFQLHALAGKLQSEGYDVTRYLVDMQSRLANPFANLIMAFLGIPFALQKGRGSSIAMGITLSVAIGVGYFILQSTLLAFGYSAVLPPVIAAWSANLLFGLLGIWLLLASRQ